MAKVFDVGREMTSPHNSGKFFGEIPMAEIHKLTTELTERERSHPDAKYYDEAMGPIQPEHEKAIHGEPIPPEDCYMPWDVAVHMNNEGYDKFENGYGVMENGVGFAAVKIDQDGITDEMIRYFRENFAHFDDLYYKTWFPQAHLLHYVNGAIENFGWAMLNMEMAFNTELSTLGFDESQILKNDPRCINILAGSGFSTDINAPESGEEVMSMLSYTRDTGKGRELRVRYWVGAAFDDFGNVFVKRRPGKVGMMQKAKMMMEHCMREYSNQNRLIREFWENRDKN